MAKQTLTDCYIAINGSVVSDHANQIVWEDKAAEIDFTTFSPAGYTQYGAGMRDATITVSFFQDYAVGSIHSIIQPLYNSAGTLLLEVRPVSSAAVSATNPKGSMTARVFSYSGINGKVGDALTLDCAFRNAGTAGLVWATA
jgi:hypothetical protein